MTITISRTDVKRKCMVSAADTSYDTSIDALISEMQPGIEYTVDDVYLNDTGNTKLQAALKLGILEIISGEFLQQLLRESGATDSVSISGLSIDAGKNQGSELIKQGNERLRPFLKQVPVAVDESKISSTTSNSSRVFTADSMKGW